MSTLLEPYNKQPIVQEVIWQTAVIICPVAPGTEDIQQVMIRIFVYVAASACWAVDNMISKQMCI